MRTSSILCITGVALSLLGCSASTDIALAEAQIQEFRKSIDAGQLELIYEQSSEDLKSSASKTDLVSLLGDINDQLGAVTSSAKKAWKFNARTNGTFVTLRYETTFTNGTAMETFVYRIKNDGAKLAGYHVDNINLTTIPQTKPVKNTT